MPNYNAPINIQPVQLENPLNNYAKIMAIQNAQNQNALAQQQLRQGQREEEQQNAMIPIMQGASQGGSIDYEKAIGSAAKLGQLKTIVALQAAQEKARETKQKHIEGQYKILADQSKAYKDLLAKVDPTSPDAVETIAAHINAQHDDPVFGPMLKKMGNTRESALDDLARSAIQPGGLSNYKDRHSLEADKVSEAFSSKPVQIDDGGKITVVEGNPRFPNFRQPITGTPVVIKVATPGELLIEKTQERGQNLAHDTAANRLAFDKNVPLHASLAGAQEKARETAKADVAIQTTKKQETVGADKVLSEINYNPNTGVDDISSLIEKSTSGALQNITSHAIGAVSGSATTGRQAIGELATKANKIALDALGGKLGAGISNTDRDFIAQSMADVANANIPANERQAAWKAAKERILKISSVSKQATPKLPAGFTPD